MADCLAVESAGTQDNSAWPSLRKYRRINEYKRKQGSKHAIPCDPLWSSSVSWCRTEG